MRRGDKEEEKMRRGRKMKKRREKKLTKNEKEEKSYAWNLTTKRRMRVGKRKRGRVRKIEERGGKRRGGGKGKDK